MVGVLLRVAVERRHLGKKCSETVTVGSGEPRRFIMCGKKHE